MPKTIFVIKRCPRKGLISDIPIAFGPLDNLYLDLIEDKSKLKKNLPPLKIKRLKLSPKKDESHISQSPTHSLSINESSSVSQSNPIDSHKSHDDKRKIKSHPTPTKDLDSRTENKDKEDVNVADDLHEFQQQNIESHDCVDELEKEFGMGGDKVINESPPIHETKPEISEPVEPNRDEEKPEKDKTDNIEVVEQIEEPELSPEEKHDKEVEDVLWELKLLKRKYPTADIPEFNEFSDLSIMKKKYKDLTKEANLNAHIERFRSICIGCFYAVQYGCQYLLNIDMSGYADLQISMMEKYDPYFVEFSQRQALQWISNLPLEVRFIGFFLFQAGLFFVMKLASDKFGNQVVDMIKGLMGIPVTKTKNIQDSKEKDKVSDSKKKKKKKTMKGPSINMDDLRK